MSAPDTNIEKQKSRHWGPIVGISFGLAVAAILFITFFGDQTELATEETAPAALEATVSE